MIETFTLATFTLRKVTWFSLKHVHNWSRLPHTRLTGLGNGDFSSLHGLRFTAQEEGKGFCLSYPLSWWVNIPSSLMFSPLFFTEMNHQASTQNPRARSKVGFVTLCVREKAFMCMCVCLEKSEKRTWVMEAHNSCCSWCLECHLNITEDQPIDTV